MKWVKAATTKSSSAEVEDGDGAEIRGAGWPPSGCTRNGMQKGTRGEEDENKYGRLKDFRLGEID